MTDSRPFMITGLDVEGNELSPLPVKRKTFDEQWLQELLHKYPSILPVEKIDESFSPPISIGREISKIDNLFINEKGLLTIVETKLFRNPEAHRTVVAQILDYAKTLSSWDYRKLDNSVRSFIQNRTGKSKSIYEIVKSNTKGIEFSEIEFQERVQDCLETGRFLLLIVGDEIRPGVTQLAETLQSAPHLQYSIGFVELQCFRLHKDSDWPLIVFPQLIAKTKEYTRAIVKVIYEEKKPEVEIFTPKDEKTSTANTTFNEFVASLPSSIADMFSLYIEKWMNSVYTVYWGSVGFSLRLIWKKKERTLFTAYPKSASILREKYINKFNLPLEPYEEYKSELMSISLFGNLFASGKSYVNYENVSEDEFEILLKSTDKLITAYEVLEKK